MLPTPHGPADPPAAPGEGVEATAGQPTIDLPPEVAAAEVRPPDTVALRLVVEHLADEPDEPADQADGDQVGGDQAGGDQAGGDEAGADEAGTDHADAVQDAEDPDMPPPAADPGTPPADAPAATAPGPDEVAPDEVGPDAPAPAAPAPDASTPDAPAPAAPEPDEVGPVAAALSDTRHTIDGLTAPEHVFLAQQRALIGELCPDVTDAAAVGALFDRVREQWTQAEDRPDPRPLADAFGVALGDLVLLRAPDLRWATCSDRYGVEIVLAREDPEVLVYPIASVSQSWATAPAGWLVTHLAHIVRGVAPEPPATDA